MASRTLLINLSRRAPSAAPFILPRAARLSTVTATPTTTTSTTTSTTTTSTTPTPTDPNQPVNPREPLAPTTIKQHINIADAIAISLKNRFPGATETYIAYEITRTLYMECGVQATYTDGMPLTPSAEFWYTRCHRDPTFNSWAQVTILHMWMLTVKIRMFEQSQVEIWQQHFIDHFFHDSEDKMVKRYGITSNAQRSGYLKDLYHQYRGAVAAFDEGLVRGDAVLATAIWRNIFNADENVDLEALAMATSYVRRVVSRLGQVKNDVVRAGGITFTSPELEVELVNQKSRLLEKIAEEVKIEFEGPAPEEKAKTKP